MLEWTYARPTLPSSAFDDAPVVKDDGPVIIPPPIEPARPCTLEDMPVLKGWGVLRPDECTVAIGWAKSTGRSVRKVRSLIGRGELWRVVLESPPGVPGQGYAFAGGWVAEGPDRKVRAVGARELKAAIVASRRPEGRAEGS